MTQLGAYLDSAKTLVPVFTALASTILVWLSYPDSLTRKERKLKRIVVVYFSMASLAWGLTFCYGYAPQVLVALNVPCILTYILIPVFFYRIIRFLTRFDTDEKFNPLHYLVPALVAIVMFVWAFFVPFEAQVEMVTGRAKIYPEGYEAYGRFFTSKPLFRMLSGFIYNTLVIVLLIRYYRRACQPGNLIRKPVRWVLFLVGISLACLFSSVMAGYLQEERNVVSVWLFIVGVGIAIQHILLTYHIVRRKYLLYVIYSEPKEKNESPSRRHHAGQINRQKLETYFREEKPYLQTDFKITEMVEVFDVNRSVISAFINKTYGMNFNRYVNGWRIKEIGRLSALPSNEGKSVGSYVKQAGFTDLRQYYRVVSHEKQYKKGKEQNKFKSDKGK